MGVITPRTLVLDYFLNHCLDYYDHAASALVKPDSGIPIEAPKSMPNKGPRDLD
jgi:hypothetical protein